MIHTTITPIDPVNAHVAIIEDDDNNIVVIQDLLSMELNVTHLYAATSGSAFFRMLDSQPDLKLDLILLDLQIPRDDGFKILQQIRTQPSLQDTKVIAVTATISSHIITRARNEGFNGYIAKPLDFDRFPKQILRILSGESVWEPS